MDLQAFLITFREALEAILIVGVILTYLTRIEQASWHKWVWVGVVLALIASYGVALAFQVVFTGFGSMGNQNYLKIGIMIVSTGLLTHMILFMNKQSNDFQGKAQSKIAAILTVGGAINMVLHSFLVVVREGVETVFFFAAITGGNIQQALQSWGALLGLVLALIVGYIFFKGAKRIKLSSFFRATSVLLVLIAAGLLVQAVGIMQDIGVMGSLYKTPGGEIGEVYNITALMPEHPTDEIHYIRDTGHHPLINGQIGLFMKAFLGYTQNPSVEEFLLYWFYFLVVFILVGIQKKRHEKRLNAAIDKEASI
ncbi:iron permease [Paenibacillus psychroresistens]|uniref:Iron permease n=1 Tax=Paenibacillus psychroresistens TaxID=1778678 RepID=A0A6B8RGK6_9BACL|nr:FTR1 family protein [Paenibacillus psychroresistens]QGQ95591.1 iron permease [Paenibacillus psychroresistens]